MTKVELAETVRRQATLTTHRLHSLPILVLMAHSRCNCRCVMCDIWKANANKRELTRDDLLPHVQSFKNLHVQRFVLSGGEALMHSNLWLLCELLKSAERDADHAAVDRVCCSRRTPRNIVRWCDEVIVSVDGSREVHDAIRRIPRAFDRLAEGVAALREPASRAIPSAAAASCSARTSAICPKIIDAAHAIGLDRISFMAADVSSTAFNRPTPWDEPRADEVSASHADETPEFGAARRVDDRAVSRRFRNRLHLRKSRQTAPITALLRRAEWRRRAADHDVQRALGVRRHRGRRSGQARASSIGRSATSTSSRSRPF